MPHPRRTAAATLISSLVPLIAAAAACPPPPMHSQVTVPGGACPLWSCAAGYYRTAPADPSLATCRPCRAVTCPAGYVPQPCNATSDTRCAMCPGDPNVVFAAGCTAPRCADGWFNATGNNWTVACAAPCPLVSYCCGKNGTTPAPGASTVLQCTPDSILGGAWLAVAFDFSVDDPPLQGDPAASCALNGQMSQVLTYGDFAACTATPRDAGRCLLWSVACYARAAADAAGLLSQRLAATLADPVVAAGIQFFMSQVCVRRDDLALGNLWVQPQPITPAVLALLQQAALSSQLPAYVPAPPHPQRLQYPGPTAWGWRTEDAVAVATALGIAGTAVPVGCMMACAGVYAQYVRRRRWGEALREMAVRRGVGSSYV